MITTNKYLDELEREYLADYIPAGGAAVKFAVTPDGTVDTLQNGLVRLAGKRSFEIVRVDAAQVKVHMVDKVFNVIAEQIKWNDLAEAFVRATIRNLGLRAPADERATVDRLAAENAYDANELRRDLRRSLQRDILQDYELAHEFRIAMLRLCEGVFDDGDLARQEAELVESWLRGELRTISALKQIRIYQKIARHNARDMLTSLTHWVVKAGRAGLVIELDLRRCAVLKRPDDGLVFYSKPAVLDTYEFLRQLIDGTDDLRSCFVLVSISPETLTDPNRGIEHNYDALKYRIWDEVRDRVRTNPLAALVRTANDGDERW